MVAEFSSLSPSDRSAALRLNVAIRRDTGNSRQGKASLGAMFLQLSRADFFPTKPLAPRPTWVRRVGDPPLGLTSIACLILGRFVGAQAAPSLSMPIVQILRPSLITEDASQTSMLK